MLRFIGLVVLLVLCLLSLPAAAQELPPFETRGHTTLERMQLPHLKAVHEEVKALEGKRVPVAMKTTLTDFYGILHAHASDSDHTGGTIEEMHADAKLAGVDVIMLTDHLRPPRDFMDSWRGLRDGVLFIPGSEAKGFLVYPEQSIMDKLELPREELAQAVVAGKGLIFLSHVEGQPTAPAAGLTGMEVYNRHADAMDDMESMKWLYGAMTDPKLVAELQEAVKLYPDEWLAAQQDYLRPYIDAWDREMQIQKTVGIAANDCHHNQVYLTKMVDAENVLVGTIVDPDEGMTKLSAADFPGIKELTQGHQPGEVLAQVDFDPYRIMLRNCGTHIFAMEQTEFAIREALQMGHAYVSSDWMADPTGFVFGGVDGDPAQVTALNILMGDNVHSAEDLRLVAEFPLPCSIRWMCNGKEIGRSEGMRAQLGPNLAPGAYRVEGWLMLDGELRNWIMSNPIYVG